MEVAIEVGVKTETEVAAVQEVTVLVGEVHQHILHYVEIIRDRGHVPGLVRTIRVYVLYILCSMITMIRHILASAMRLICDRILLIEKLQY